MSKTKLFAGFEPTLNQSRRNFVAFLGCGGVMLATGIFASEKSSEIQANSDTNHLMQPEHHNGNYPWMGP